MSDIDKDLESILGAYQESFTGKIYNNENNDSDLLMEVFGITPELKRENRQYWGRELGMCWQRLVIEIFKAGRPDDYGDAIKTGGDEPCDLVVGKYAIDTKYRIGSGDSGTLKKFKTYGKDLRAQGYEPLFLILRTDNLPAAITACNVGTWKVLTGDESLKFVEDESGFKIREFLQERARRFAIQR